MGESEEAGAGGELMAAYEALYGRDEQQEGGITREREEGRKREREEEAGAGTAVTTPCSGKRRGQASIASPRFQPTPGGEGHVSEPTPTSERSGTSLTAPAASESVVDTAAHASNSSTKISTSNMSSSNMSGAAASLKPRKLVMPARSRTSA